MGREFGDRRGQIAWLGRDDDVTLGGRPLAEVIDLQGRAVIPGIVDAHNHLRLGTGGDAVHLGGAMSLPAIHARISDWLQSTQQATWVYGETWEYPAFPGGRRPRADDLDGVTGGRPAFLLDLAVHTAWLNREALAAFGITATPHTSPLGLSNTIPSPASPQAVSMTSLFMGYPVRVWRALRTSSPPSRWMLSTPAFVTR